MSGGGDRLRVAQPQDWFLFRSSVVGDLPRHVEDLFELAGVVFLSSWIRSIVLCRAWSVARLGLTACRAAPGLAVTGGIRSWVAQASIMIQSRRWAAPAANLSAALADSAGQD